MGQLRLRYCSPHPSSLNQLLSDRLHSCMILAFYESIKHFYVGGWVAIRARQQSSNTRGRRFLSARHQFASVCHHLE